MRKSEVDKGMMEFLYDAAMFIHMSEDDIRGRLIEEHPFLSEYPYFSIVDDILEELEEE